MPIPAARSNLYQRAFTLDSGGNLVAFQRMDGAQLASIQISEHKARTARHTQDEVACKVGAATIK